MDTPLLTWSITTGLFVVILITRLAIATHKSLKGDHRLFSKGNEREMFFIPGDRTPTQAHDYDDFEDL